jgi:hypothetical protein
VTGRVVASAPGTPWGCLNGVWALTTGARNGRAAVERLLRGRDAHSSSQSPRVHDARGECFEPLTFRGGSVGEWVAGAAVVQCSAGRPCAMGFAMVVVKQRACSQRPCRAVSCGGSERGDAEVGGFVSHGSPR